MVVNVPPFTSRLPVSAGSLPYEELNRTAEVALLEVLNVPLLMVALLQFMITYWDVLSKLPLLMVRLP